MRTPGKRLYQLVLLVPLIIFLVGVLGFLRINSSDARGSETTAFKPERIQFIEDRNGTLQIENICSLPDSLFMYLEKGVVPNFSFSTSAYWLRFDVPGNCVNALTKLIEVQNPLLNEAILYERHHTEIRLVCETGDAYPFDSRMVAHHNYIYPVEIPRAEMRQYYLKISSGGEQLLAPIAIRDERGLSLRDAKDQLLRGSYFGLIIFVLLFNLFIYLIIRERSSLYYVHYNFNLLLLQFSLSGYAFHYLWPDNPWMANVANPFFASMSVFSLLRFSQHFLNLKEFYSGVNSIFKWVGMVIMCNAMLSLVWHNVIFSISILVVNGVALSLNLAIIPIAVMVLRKNFKPAKFFLFGFVVLVLTVFGFIATNAGLLRSDFYADYGLLIGSAAEVVLLSLAIVDRFKSFKDQALSSLQEINRMEREANVVLERKVEERTEEILVQKNQIEEQRKEIIDSIRYAERIQKNVLPTEDDVRGFFPESFVFYQPKDIVSGDFYWGGRTMLNGVEGPPHEVLMLATGDCTGHGVPGAMMSVMSINLLRETIAQFKDDQPDVLLQKLDERLLKNMNGSGNAHAGDGMDIGLLAIQKETRELVFCGANQNLFIFRNGECIELKGTRRPIGMRDATMTKPFTSSSFQLKNDDMLYAFTDGLPDQFGGEDGKKLKKKGMLDFLNGISAESVAKQKPMLVDFFNSWKNEYEQVDDVCLVGVRIVF